MLLQAGWPEDAEVHICARLSYEDETILHTSLRGAMTEEKFTYYMTGRNIDAYEGKEVKDFSKAE